MAATPWVLLAEKTWHSPILILGVHRFLVCQQSAYLGRNVADPGVGEERKRWDSWISVLPPAASSHGMSTRTALWGQERCQQQSQGASKSQEHSESDGWSKFILPKQWLPLESLLHSSPDSGHMELWHLLAAIILPQMWLGTLEPDLDFLSQRLNLNSVFLRAKKKKIMPGAVIFSHMIERCWLDGFPHGKEVAMLLKRPICHGIYLWHKSSLETNTAFCGKPRRNHSLHFWKAKQKRREIK